jgi:hypothetical protein
VTFAPFRSNYPQFVPHQVTVLPTPQRLGALTDVTGDGSGDRLRGQRLLALIPTSKAE